MNEQHEYPHVSNPAASHFAHGGYAQGYTPGQWTAGTVLETLARCGVNPPRIQLIDDGSDHGMALQRRPVEADLLATSRGRGNYRVIGEIGRDVISYVLEAEDADLGRRVAMKVLRDEHLANPVAMRVFVQEARVAAQLQHDGILPVYDFGLHPDGRPYYTMKIVRGRSLASLLNTRKSIAAERRRYLSIFEQVCKAIAYAHGRGVAHCGIDPESIIVGSHDETQVVHWASARLLAPGDGVSGDGSPDSRPIAPPDNLPHMAPEAARGDLEACDERTDVFSLGSILCQILTGEPAYTGLRPEDLRSAAGQARLDDAYRRLDDRTDVPELAALARNCLVGGQSGRPRTAAQVLEALNHAMLSLDERRGQAEFSAKVAQDEATRERRIARRSRVIAEGVLLAGLLIAAGVYFHMNERDLQRRTVLADIQQEIECVQFLWSQARSSEPGDTTLWDEAMVAVSRATSHLNAPGIDDSVRSRVAFVAENLKIERNAALERAARETRDMELLEALEAAGAEESDVEPERRAARLAAVFESFGLDPLAAEGEAGRAALVASLRESAAEDELLDALDRWAQAALAAGLPESDALFEVAASADEDPLRNRIRAALRSQDPKALAAVVSEIDPMEVDARTAVLAARGLCQAGRTPAAIRLLQDAQAMDPGDYAINYELAACFARNGQGDYGEAVRYYTTALAARPGSVEARQKLSHALEQEGRLEESMDVLRAALALEPGDARLQVRLGGLHLALGEPEQASRVWRRAVQDEAATPASLALLGEELQLAGDYGGAAMAFDRWARLSPEDARAYIALGDVARARGQHEEAALQYGRAVEVDGGSKSARVALGDLYLELDRSDEAIATYFEVLRADPRDAEVQRRLGRAFEQREEWDDAAVAFRDSLILDPHHEEACAKLYMLLCEQAKSPDAAAQAFRQVAQAQPDSALVNHYLGRCELARGEHAAGAEALAAAVRLDGDDARSHALLGRAELALGDSSAGLAELRKAIELAPDNVRFRTDLGASLASLGRHSEAVEAFGAALALAPRDANLHYRRGNSLQRAGRLEDAHLAYLEAIRLRPDHAEAHCSLGALFKAEGDYLASLEAYRLGHEIGSQRASWQHPSADWLSEAERLVAAQSELDAVVEGAAPPRATEDLVRLASMARRRGLDGTSARLYATAIEDATSSELRDIDRFQAARAAAQAGAGAREEAAALTDRERERWRKTALRWLEEELVFLLEEDRAERLDEGELRRTAESWLADAELAVVRDKDALALLPAAEQEAFGDLWERVSEVAGR